MNAGAGASSMRQQPLFSLSTPVQPLPRSRHSHLPKRPAPMRYSCMTGTTAWDPQSATASRTPARAKTPQPDRRWNAAAGQASALSGAGGLLPSRQPRPGARWSATEYRHEKLNPARQGCPRHHHRDRRLGGPRGTRPSTSSGISSRPPTCAATPTSSSSPGSSATHASRRPAATPAPPQKTAHERSTCFSSTNSGRSAPLDGPTPPLGVSWPYPKRCLTLSRCRPSRTPSSPGFNRPGCSSSTATRCARRRRLGAGPVATHPDEAALASW